MTREAQQAAIAEACGWTEVRMYHPNEHTDVWGGHRQGTPFGCWSRLPNYLNDLNAMHEAEKVLIRGGFTTAFYSEMVAVTTVDRFFLVHATAAQRAEAFLRTIGKWTEA